MPSSDNQCRTIRVRSLVRWIVISAHTAFAASAVILALNLGDSRREQRLADLATEVLFVADLPTSIVVMILMLPLIRQGDMHAVAVRFFVLCGAFGWIQYYLSIGLLARWTWGTERRVAITGLRAGLFLAASLLLIAGVAIVPWIPYRQRTELARSDRPYIAAEPVFTGDSRRLSRSAVVPTLDTPMPEGKSVIWCATFQMAWDRLKDDIVGEPILLANAQPVADRLNAQAISATDLPEESYYAAAGFGKDGIVEKIRAEMRERFQKEPMDLGEVPVILAYAYLRASVPFTLPYFDNEEALVFTDSQGRPTSVSSFGLRRKDESGYYDLREQVQVLYSQSNTEMGQPTEYAIDLCRDSKPNQVILACVPRRETLLATLQDAERKIAEQSHGRVRHLPGNSVLLVPNLNWSLQHRFRELDGPDKRLLNPKLQDLYVDTALQTIDFRLDRSGVELQSEAKLVVECTAPEFLFNCPFLIIVKKRGAERPFFVMWVDNAELLCKFAQPPPRSSRW